MRLVLNLKSRNNCVQNKENNSKFYSGVHGWIYNKLKETDFAEIYFKKEFKPFCFSNIFPVSESIIKESRVYSVIVSSPDEMFMIALLSKMNINETVNLGEYSFELIGYKPLPRLEIKNNSILESETIVNVSLNENSKRRSITLTSDSKLFKENLSKNLIKKYNHFAEENMDENINLWDNIQIEEIKNSKFAIKINFIKNSDNWFNLIGARYNFKIGNIDEMQKKVLQLCYDLGFGERNTFGFGFMNIKNQERGENE